MAAVDLLLTVACVLLWLNWRSGGVDGRKSAGIALVSTLRRAEGPPRDRWRSPTIIFSILLIRAIVYWGWGPTVQWIPKLSFAAVVLHFRNDVFLRTLVFSFLSFAVWLTSVYFCFLLFAVLHRKEGTRDPWLHMVRGWLGPLNALPDGIKLLLPAITAFAFWSVMAPLLARIGVHAAPLSAAHLLQQAGLIAVGAWLPWRFAIAVVLGIHIVTSYVYFGNAPFWKFITATAGKLLRPVSTLPLRVGRVDLAPVFLLVAVFAFGELVRYWLPRAFGRLPF